MEQYRGETAAVAAARMSELDSDAELVAPIDQRPTRLHIHGLGPRGCRRITKYLLLIDGLGVQKVGRIERQLDMGAYRVAYGAVEEPRSFLEYRQTNAAIQIGRQVHGAPVVSEAYSDRSLLIQSNEIEGMIGNPRQFMRIDDNTGDHRNPGTDCAHAAGRCRVDQIGVVYAGGIDIGIVGLQPQAAPESGQEVKKGLIGDFKTLDPAAILFIDRASDLRSLRCTIVGERAAEIVVREAVR